MARTPRPSAVFPQADPLDDAVNADRETIADALSGVLEALSGVDQGTIKGILYRIPVPNGKYEWIRDVYPPFDLSDIMRSLKEDIGGGDFALRIMAEGKPRKTIHFSIMKEKQPLMTEKQNGGDTMMLIQMMMQQSAEASRQAQAAADRQMQMMMAGNQQSTQMMLGLVTAMMGGREKVADLVPLFAAMQQKPDNGGLLETLTVLKSAKEIFGGEPAAEKFNPDDLVGSALKLAGPIAGAVGRAFSNRGGQGEAAEAPQDPGGHPPPLMLPSAPQPAPGGTGQYPVLDLIRDDVLFMFKRNHDPARAADVVYDTIEAANVSEDALNELVAAFTLSPDWLTDLANEGIDLRSRPEWAQQFLTALVGIHTDALSEDDDFEGATRDAANAGDHEASSAGRLPPNAGAETGG